MNAVLGLLLALLTIEGLLLITWPAHVKAVIHDMPEGALRIAGVVELILVIIVLVLVCRLF